jgi:hypothetical protein
VYSGESFDGKSERKSQLEDLSINGKVILKWNLNRVFGRGVDITAWG